MLESARHLATSRFTQPGRPFFYGWLMLGFAGLGVFASGPGQSHTFSVFLDPIGQDLGLGKSAIASAYGLASLVAALLLPVMGKVLDKTGSIFVQKGNKDALDRPFKADKTVSESDDGVFDARAPTMVNNTLYGYVEMGLNIASVTESVSRVKQWTITLALLEFVLVGLCSYLLGSYLMSQLQQLREGAKHLGEAIENNNYKQEN